MKIAALALAMTTIFTLSPFVAALGYKTAVIAKEPKRLRQSRPLGLLPGVEVTSIMRISRSP